MSMNYKSVNKLKVSEDLLTFVNNELFTYLQKFRDTAENINTIQYKFRDTNLRNIYFSIKFSNVTLYKIIKICCR